MRFARALSVAVALFATRLALAQSPPLTVSFSKSTPDATANDTVAIDGATPRGKVLIISLQRYADGLTSIMVPTASVIAADVYGHASISATANIAFRSDCAVVDFSSGRYVLPQQDGSNSSPAPPPTLGNFGGHLTDIFTAAGSVDVFYIDPGNGALSLHANDGEAEDVDGTANGVAGVRVGAMGTLIAPATSITTLNDNGVIVAIDNDTMQIVGALVKELRVVVP